MSWQHTYSLNIITYNTRKLNTLFSEHKIRMSEDYKQGVTLVCESLLQVFYKYLAFGLHPKLSVSPFPPL